MPLPFGPPPLSSPRLRGEDEGGGSKLRIWKVTIAARSIVISGRHLARHFIGKRPGRGERKFSGFIYEVPSFTLDGFNFVLGNYFFALKFAGETGDGIFFLPFGYL